MAALKALASTLFASASLAAATAAFSSSALAFVQQPKLLFHRSPALQSHSSVLGSDSSPTKFPFLHRGAGNLFLAFSGATVVAQGSASATQARLHQSAMDTTSQRDESHASPDLMTEFMVDMKCEGCVSAVRDKLEKLEGVKRVDVDLPNQVVKVLGSTSLKALNAAMERTGRKSRLIGQGSPEEFLVSAAVAEFKGPQIHGVVRFVQVTMEFAQIDASFSGLPQGSHGWSINEYGDLTLGAASTGQIFNPSMHASDGSNTGPLGDLGVLTADETGEAEYSKSMHMLKVADLIGRALVLYETEDKSVPGIAAAVIARSAGVGQNYKKLCTCDGTVIWESTNNDFVKA
eukprot:c26227_g1_i1 orf=580-1620(-)